MAALLQVFELLDELEEDELLDELLDEPLDELELPLTLNLGSHLPHSLAFHFPDQYSKFQFWVGLFWQVNQVRATLESTSNFCGVRQALKDLTKLPVLSMV